MTTKVRNMMAIVLLVAGLGLAGCGSDEKTVTVNGDKVTVDQDGDGVKIETDDGSATFGAGASLPADFPEDDVPLVDGEIVGGAKDASSGAPAWSVIMKAEGDAESVLAEVTEKLKDAGYTSESSMNMGGASVAEFSGKYDVVVSVSSASGELVVTYAVATP